MDEEIDHTNFKFKSNAYYCDGKRMIETRTKKLKLRLV
jgi:hypothetical protein